jgi:hypothetical protein
VDELLPFILIGSILDVHHRQREQEFLVGGVEKKPLVSGVATIQHGA